MKKVSRVIIGGTLIALGCGCFLYPNFREWNTQREVESVIHKFDETYSKGIDSDITSEPVKTSDKNDTADMPGQPANESDNKSETADDDNEKTDTGSSKNNTVTNTPKPTSHELTSKGDDKAGAEQQTAGNTDSTGNTSEDSETALSENTDSDSDTSDDEESATRPYQTLYDEMEKYNKDLTTNGQDIVDAWSYEQQPLDLSSVDMDEDNPVIGYIEIPDMKIRLPLMLGASTKNLEKGAAVLSETSMPIGGEDTNCVIAGHRGWEGSAYFQFIENMKKGSKVYITNPWETLVYECTSTQVIYPDDVQSILIQPGKDMVTLFTCHPYVLGGGPYRYLVFCERVDTQKRKEANGILNPDATTPAPAEEAGNVVVTEPEEAESSNDSTSESTDEDLSVENPAQTPGSNDDLSVDKEEQSTQNEAGTGNTTTDISPTPAEETTLDESLENDPEVKKAEEKGKRLLALEQTLRYMLPVVLIALSAIIILFRANSKPKRRKRKRKNTVNRKAKPRPKKKEK